MWPTTIAIFLKTNSRKTVWTEANHSICLTQCRVSKLYKSKKELPAILDLTDWQVSHAHPWKSTFHSARSSPMFSFSSFCWWIVMKCVYTGNTMRAVVASPCFFYRVNIKRLPKKEAFPWERSHTPRLQHSFEIEISSLTNNEVIICLQCGFLFLFTILCTHV